MKVHLFGAASSPACASFYLRQSGKDFGHLYSVLQKFWLVIFMWMIPCFFFETKTEAICVIKEWALLLEKGGFHLAKWSSNNSGVLQSIPEEKAAELSRL